MAAALIRKRRGKRRRVSARHVRRARAHYAIETDPNIPTPDDGDDDPDIQIGGASDDKETA
jgi:hypothetical protein